MHSTLTSFKYVCKSQFLLFFCFFLLGVTSIVNVWNTYLKNFELYGEYILDDIVESESAYEGSILCHVSDVLFSRRESYKLIITAEQVCIFLS